MRLLIVAAKEDEMEVLLQELTKANDYQTKSIEGFLFHIGKIKKSEIILVKSGVGRVNSAILISIAKMNFDLDGVMNIGVAGGINGAQFNHVIIGENTVYGDVDLSVLEHKKYVYGQMSGCPEVFKADETMFSKIREFTSNNSNVITGTICSCERFTTNYEEAMNIINSYFKKLNVIAFDMESASFAQSCYRFNLPFIAIRFISDLIGSQNQVGLYIQNEEKVATNQENNALLLDIIERLVD